MKIDQLREEYTYDRLDQDSVPNNPLILFDSWFKDAKQANILEPNAMILATSTKTGVPSARVVLLKGYGPEGFTFYTNYQSQKGNEINDNPIGSAVFFWKPIERQVRLSGQIKKTDKLTSELYFQSRPKKSQVGAWASPQSQIIESRDILEKNFASINEKYQNENTLPLPPNWGGYTIEPQTIEFWQGRRSRLHDRIRYEKSSNSWTTSRLAP